MTEFFHMGGYASFVWGSYGLSFVVLVLIAVLAGLRHKRALNEVTQRAKRELRKEQ